jgi:hypothetical protein
MRLQSGIHRVPPDLVAERVRSRRRLWDTVFST